MARSRLRRGRSSLLFYPYLSIIDGGLGGVGVEPDPVLDVPLQ